MLYRTPSKSIWYNPPDHGRGSFLHYFKSYGIVLFIMGVPRAHSTRAQKGRRRSHLALTKLVLVTCSQCKKPNLPHTVCKSCGYYEGVEVVNVLGRELKKKEKKAQRQA